jgi:hypothetical protein
MQSWCRFAFYAFEPWTDKGLADGHQRTQIRCERDPFPLQFITVSNPAAHFDAFANSMIVCVQLGNIIAANIYRTADKPLYHKGNTHLIIINVLVIFLFLFTKVYYVTRNRFRDKKWDAMSVEVSNTHRVDSLQGKEWQEIS